MFAALVALTACGSDETGQPTAQVGGPTANVGDSTGNKTDVETPQVVNPVQNLEKYKQAPCSMLTHQQAESIDFPRPEDATEAGQPGCRWRGYRDSRVTITIQSGKKWTLAGYYEVHAEYPESYAYFEPLKVDGFPAVFASDFDQRKTGGSCAMTVALTNQDVLRMSNGLFLGTAQRNDPCAQLQETAELAVKTISAGK